VGVESIGSRPSEVKPEKWTRRSQPELAETTELFVAGSRRVFSDWAERLPNWIDNFPGADQIVSIEQIRPQRPEDRMQHITSKAKELVLEIVLHATPASNFILEGFEVFLKSLGLKANLDRRFYVGGLCFLPLMAPRELISKTAEFSFLRVIREMPRLRTLNPYVRSIRARAVPCSLPVSGVISPNTRVAIFDGGLPQDSPMTRWVLPVDPPGVGEAVPEYLEHGHQVTSALLFGSVKQGEQLLPPFCGGEHYRVLDKESATDPLELYDVLQRIRTVLQNERYEFINLSIGPELTVEDKEVHGWTAFFDQYLDSAMTLATIAVGNSGENDRASGNARIQVPSDCVNGLSIGACDSLSKKWKRASYSSIGPGRSPGLVKPDVLAFGGTELEPFWVINRNNPTLATPTMGTSFATPAGLRLAVGIRAFLGDVITPLAAKALLIHCSEDELENRPEHGWGRIPETIEDFIICPRNTARILYRGELSAAQYLRAQIPTPVEEMMGMVTIRATFCYATKTDPEDPGNYTRSGLIVTFRPHDQKFSGKDHKKQRRTQYAKSKSFFTLKEFAEETELRQDAHKWETTLHRERRFQSASLRNPLFDIHYNARSGGGPDSAARKIQYALVVSVTAPNTPEVYDRVVRRYATRLRPLQPIISIPIRT
jgi:Subtilase family